MARDFRVSSRNSFIKTSYSRTARSFKGRVHSRARQRLTHLLPTVKPHGSKLRAPYTTQCFNSKDAEVSSILPGTQREHV